MSVGFFLRRDKGSMGRPGLRQERDKQQEITQVRFAQAEQADQAENKQTCGPKAKPKHRLPSLRLMR